MFQLRHPLRRPILFLRLRTNTKAEASVMMSLTSEPWTRGRKQQKHPASNERKKTFSRNVQEGSIHHLLYRHFRVQPSHQLKAPKWSRSIAAAATMAILAATLYFCREILTSGPRIKAWKWSLSTRVLENRLRLLAFIKSKQNTLRISIQQQRSCSNVFEIKERQPTSNV